MSDTPNRMSVEELQTTQEFQKLTLKQQLFVATYCAGGLADGCYDQVSATNTAYQCKSLEVARIMSYSLMSNIRVIAALNRHFKIQPIEEFLALIDRAIRNKKLTVAQIQALKLKGDILGFTTRLPGTNNWHAGTMPKNIVESNKAERKARKKARAVVPMPALPPAKDPIYDFGV